MIIKIQAINSRAQYFKGSDECCDRGARKEKQNKRSARTDGRDPYRARHSCQQIRKQASLKINQKQLFTTND
jgi:hypothetical protein